MTLQEQQNLRNKVETLQKQVEELLQWRSQKEKRQLTNGGK